ncbi:hypothetical protein C8J56DRAFT_29886 [Mycena floridula]|nr:hypothetical protein C8J56DRAFT_29886 [Mycena floridula]
MAVISKVGIAGTWSAIIVLVESQLVCQVGFDTNFQAALNIVQVLSYSILVEMTIFLLILEYSDSSPSFNSNLCISESTYDYLGDKYSWRTSTIEPPHGSILTRGYWSPILWRLDAFMELLSGGLFVNEMDNDLHHRVSNQDPAGDRLICFYGNPPFSSFCPPFCRSSRSPAFEFCF